MFKEIIPISIQNTTSSSLPVNLLGGLGITQDNSNATTAYVWDITSYVYSNETLIEFQVRVVGTTTWTIASVGLGGTTKQDIVNSLNTLPYGSFGLLDTGLNQYIFNYNLLFEFGYINIYNPTIVPTTFTGALISVGDILSFDINAVNQVTFAGIVPLSGTYNAAVGDTLNVYGITGAIGFTLKIEQYPDAIIIAGGFIPPLTPFTYPFIAVSTKNYEVNVSP